MSGTRIFMNLFRKGKDIMLGKVYSAAVLGIEAELITAEADV